MSRDEASVSATNSAFARGMKLSREKSGMSIRQLARAVSLFGDVDMHFTTIHKIEAEQRKVSIGEAVAIASAFGSDPVRIIASGRGAS